MATTDKATDKATGKARVTHPTPVGRHDGFRVITTAASPGRNVPQRIGRLLWAPMLAMALMAFPVAIVLAIVRANDVADGAQPSTIAAYAHLVPGVMFTGFASVFAAISFAIARILGEFRKGGGEVQETVGVPVQTLRMPATAKAFLAFMAMGMMTILTAVVLHFVAAAAIAGDSAYALAHSEQWAVWLEGVRRIGVALYLVGITLGLATIITVLRFQTTRVRELPDLVGAQRN